MQVTKVLLNILGMKHVRVRSCEFEEEGIVIDVAPTTRIARCGGSAVSTSPSSAVVTSPR
jgi:hypothetical protein